MKVREVAGEHIVMRIGDGKKVDMTTVIAFNESSLLLTEKLRGHEFGLDEAVEVLMSEYDIDEATARRDAEAWLQQMRDNSLLEVNH